MTGKLLLLLLSVGCLILAPLKTLNAAEDRKTLEDTWILVSAELGGRKLPLESFQNARLTLTGGRYTYHNELGDDLGTYKLIAAAAPKALEAMDITGTAGPNKGKTFLAVYELAGDTLRICYDLDGKKRPGEFATQAGTHQFLATYKRAKA